MRWVWRVAVVAGVAGPAVDMFSTPALVALAVMLAIPAAVTLAPDPRTNDSGEVEHGDESARAMGGDRRHGGCAARDRHLRGAVPSRRMQQSVASH